MAPTSVRRRRRRRGLARLRLHRRPAVNATVAAEAEQAADLVRARRRRGGVRGLDARRWVATPGLTVAVHAAGDPRRGGCRADRCIEALHTAPTPSVRPSTRRGTVALVGAGPGDPGLLTDRARQLLALADVVVTDRLVPVEALAGLRPDVAVVDATKLPGGRAMAQEQICAELVEHARAGRFVVRLKGGDPFVFGRGMEEVLACTEAGVPVEVVPGVSSAIAVPPSPASPSPTAGPARRSRSCPGTCRPGTTGRPSTGQRWRARVRRSSC
jgi:uroporphyrin-III C-methyltransferase/precorrin-2 dehydrogenase/sirohydrochlorin ferrochelatase